MSPWLWRRAYYAVPGRQSRLRQPVISVGNISMGGRGKTPLVAHIARMLVEAGERPAILSRGYGRRVVEDGVVVVSDGRRQLADLDRGGDEPLLLARQVPGAVVLVAESRAIAGALAERAFGATVHILDDGFQHLTLARDADIVAVAPADLADRPSPFGGLREPVAALVDADAVVVDGARPPGGVRTPGLVFTMRRSIGAPVPIEPDRDGTLARGPVVALAGIARPGRFTESLAAAGWTVAGEVGFGDHHRYTRADLARLVDAARSAGASAVCTTEKDAMRLRPFRPLPLPIYAVPLVVEVDQGADFRRWLFDRLEARRP